MFKQFGFIADKSIYLKEPISLIREPILKMFNAGDKYIPSGWGFGFYRSKGAFILKKGKERVSNEVFDNLSGSVSSNVFLSHLAPAEENISRDADCQPFRWGKWLFMHSGVLGCTKRTKTRIKKNLPSTLVNSIDGSTGSELIFFQLISYLRGKGGIKKGRIPYQGCIEALKLTLKKIDEIHEEIKCSEVNVFNFMISNGSYLVVYRQGPPLYYSTLRLTREMPAVTHFKTGVVSSNKFEKITEWQELPDRNLLVFDENINPILFDNLNV